MINRQRTIELFGYDPDKWGEKSAKKVVRICDRCGKEQIVRKERCNLLCRSCAQKGENHPMWRKHHTKETKVLMCKVHKRENLSEETLKKMSESHKRENLSEELLKHYSDVRMGKNNPAWKGGISFGRYCEKFNSKKKKEVRDKYGNCDYLTGIHKDICNVVNGRIEELIVHHVDYNKLQGCDGYDWLLVPVSRRHNSMFNKNRPFWERLILYALKYDQEYYIDKFNNVFKSREVINVY